jgi:hypothetical protein
VIFVDDILFSPVKGFFWIMRELQKAVQNEQENEVDRLTARLSELYMLLETGKLTQDEFDVAEREVLDRLDELEGQEPEAGELDEEGVEAQDEIDEDDEDIDDDEAEDEADDESDEDSEGDSGEPEMMDEGDAGRNER